MDKYNNISNNITTEYILQVLKKEGIAVDVAQAKQLLEFFNLIADILIDDFLGV